MSKFSDSVARIKRERFRDLATQYGKWPDRDVERQFDDAVGELKRKRELDYVGKIMKKYNPEFVGKVMDWARNELSEMEINKLKTFEDLSVAYIQANEGNPDKVSSDEIAQFFDSKSGKLKQTIEDPEDRPLDLNNLEVDDYGNVSEKPPAPRMKVAPRIPDIAEARRMTSDELAAILPKGD